MRSFYVGPRLHSNDSIHKKLHLCNIVQSSNVSCGACVGSSIPMPQRRSRIVLITTDE